MDQYVATVKRFLPKSKEDGYANISTNDQDNYSEPPRTKDWRPSTLLSALLKLTIISLALHSLISLSITTITTFFLAASLPPCYCGTSVSEAVSLNCKFDSLSTSWLPPHCRDDELTALFERAGPGPNGEWTYYRTQPHLGDNLTAAAKFTVDELALLSEKSEAERQVVATVEWHDKHCFFLLLKMVRGKAPRMGYTGFPEVLGHAEHCAMSMVQAQGVPGYYPIIGVVPGFGDPV
ncbi:hypothetical protein QBC37DRAFT_80813 [Rhypophila decipiens]|uniref:Uncharacterized protein n=1 Tax=Rhypophila decipiens TaxID=261697 RepID=A0AAN7BDA5_9PEZI|nr:hypothetical protein QBC37DRAFT_80813 [Rhypophila decipiens]